MTPLVLKPSEGCRDSTGPPQRSERTSAQGLALGNVPSRIEKARGFTARRLRSTTEATTLRTNRAAMLSPDTWRGVPPAEKSAIDLRRGLPRLPRLRSGAGRAARKKDGVGSRGITCDLQRKAKAHASGEIKPSWSPYSVSRILHSKLCLRRCWDHYVLGNLVPMGNCQQ